MRARALLGALCLCAVARGDTVDSRFHADPDHPRWAPSRSYDLEHVAVELGVDLARRHIAGRVKLTLTTLVPAAEIPLHAQELDVHSAWLDGAPAAKLTFARTDHGIAVRLPRITKRGERLTLVVDYEASPRLGLYFRGKPLEAWTQGQSEDTSGWVPIWDYPNDKATSELTLTVPADLVTVANGKLISVTDDAARKTRTWHWQEATPHATYLLSFVVGDYKKTEARAGDVPVEYYTHPATDAATVERTFGRTPKMIQFLAELTGIPYPYEKYSQIVVDGFLWGGMENVTATTLSDRELVEAEVAGEDDSDDTVVHEIAHQWFGDLVTCRDWANLWLNEGFAAFIELLWNERVHGADELDLHLRQRRGAYHFEDLVEHRRPMVTPYFRDPSTMFDSHAYSKGALILHMLRRLLGDERFFAGVREYLKRHAKGLADTHDLAAALADVSGESLDWFFDQWVYRAGYPQLTLSWKWDDAARAVRIDARQTSTAGASEPPFRLPVVVEVWTGAPPSGHRERQTLTIDAAKQTLWVPAPSRPTLVLVDPDRDLAGAITWQRPAAQAIDQLNHPRAAARLDASDELAGADPSDVVIRALVRCLAADPFHGVRESCAAALGRLRTHAAGEALSRALTGDKADKDPRVRRAAAAGLAGFSAKLEPGVADALARALAGDRADKSPHVRYAAADALGRVRAPGAFDTLSAALKIDSYRDDVRRGAMFGLLALRDPRALALVLPFTARAFRPATRSAALEVAVGLAEIPRTASPAAEPDRDVREAALALLAEGADDTDLLRQVIEALSGSSDTTLLDAIDKLGERHINPLVRTAAGETADAMRARMSARAQGSDVAQKLDELRDENRELRRRLDALEAKRK